MDIWYFPRTELARKYLEILDVGISSSLGIVAPRRKGKTLFVLNDISELARKQQYIPVYASFWQNINAPHEGLMLALEEALDALERKIPFTQLLSAKIKKTSLGNELIGKLEVEFADSPKKPDSKELMRLDQLLTQLQHKAKNKTVLLLIDEIQHLATSPHFDGLTHALRTMLDKRAGKVKAILTGSSRHYMHLLFNETQSPFYHFVETVPFPDLDEAFIEFLVVNLRQRYEKNISAESLRRAFIAVDRSPYWMMKLISHMITFNEVLDVSVKYILELIEVAEGFEQIVKRLKPIDKIIFLELSEGHSPFSQKLLERIDRETSVKGVYPNVQRSLKRLIEYQLVTQRSKGEYEIEKPGFKAYLTRA